MENIEQETSLAENQENIQALVKQENSEIQTPEKVALPFEQNSVPENMEQQDSHKIKLKEDLQKIATLINLKLINQKQGQNLMNHVIKKAYDSVSQKKVENVDKNEKIVAIDKDTLFSEFNKNNSDFFKQEGRNEIINYLKADNIKLDKDELLEISKLIEKVEQTAIDKYLKKVTYEKNLEESNNVAKQRLQANAQNSKNDGKNFTTFSREQIGKMSSAEFAKNESLIMEQLKKGLIK